jgi:hypothetical protein
MDRQDTGNGHTDLWLAEAEGRGFGGAPDRGPSTGYILRQQSGSDEDMAEEESWTQYRRLILAELQRINDTIVEVDKKLDRMRSDDISQLKVDVAMLQVKSGVWGGLAGAIVAVAAVFMTYVGGG